MVEGECSEAGDDSACTSPGPCAWSCINARSGARSRPGSCLDPCTSTGTSPGARSCNDSNAYPGAGS